MKILLHNLGKKFNGNWIFQDLDYSMESGKSYAILGSNGSGKSTLLKIISGYMTPSRGSISYENSSSQIEPESIYQYISATTPYYELYQDLSLKETFDFQSKLNPMNISGEEFVESVDLPPSRLIGEFSSGMKQKLKLGLALFSTSPIILFDEPTNNLDEKTRKWFSEQVSQIVQDRLIIVCSNFLKEEYAFCTEELEIEQFKP